MRRKLRDEVRLARSDGGISDRQDVGVGQMPEDLRLYPLPPGSDVRQQLEGDYVVLVVVEDFVDLALPAGPDLTSHDIAVVD